MRITELSVNPGNRIDKVTKPWSEKYGVRISTRARNFSAHNRDVTSSEFHPTAY